MTTAPTISDPAALLAAGLGEDYTPLPPSPSPSLQAWMVYDWLVHDAIPGLLEAAELPELATVLLELPWCSDSSDNYHAMARALAETNHALIELMDTTSQLDARQAWGWSWGPQSTVIELSGIPAAVLVIRDNMSRVTAGPPASTVRLLSKLFVIPDALATAVRADATKLLAALATGDPSTHPARTRTPRQPSPDLLAPPTQED
jgi:hypothetical protein